MSIRFRLAFLIWITAIFIALAIGIFYKNTFPLLYIAETKQMIAQKVEITHAIINKYMAQQTVFTDSLANIAANQPHSDINVLFSGELLSKTEYDWLCIADSTAPITYLEYGHNPFVSSVWQKLLPDLFQNETSITQGAHTIIANDGPIFLTYAQFTTIDKKSKVLMLGKKIKHTFAEQIGKEIGASINIWPMGYNHLNSQQQQLASFLEHASQLKIVQVSQEIWKAYFIRPTMVTQDPVLFELTFNIPKYLPQQKIEKLIFFSAIAALFILTGIILLGLERSVFFPLRNLTFWLNEAKKNDDLKIKMQHPFDEVGKLCNALEHFSLKQERNHVIHQEQAFQNGRNLMAKEIFANIHPLIEEVLSKINYLEQLLACSSTIPLEEIRAHINTMKAISPMDTQENIESLETYISNAIVLHEQTQTVLLHTKKHASKILSNTRLYALTFESEEAKEEGNPSESK